MRALICAVVLCLSGVSHADTPTWPGDSLFQLDDTWVDQDQTKRQLSDWAGHPVIVAMVFTRCQYSCPLIIRQLKALDAKLTDDEKAKVRVVLVSLDPTHDTPAVLKAFAKKDGLDLKRWTLLNGDAAHVRALSVALNVRFKATGKGEFSHGRGLTVMGPAGVVRYQGEEEDAVLAALRAK